MDKDVDKIIDILEDKIECPVCTKFYYSHDFMHMWNGEEDEAYACNRCYTQGKHFITNHE